MEDEQRPLARWTDAWRESYGPRWAVKLALLGVLVALFGAMTPPSDPDSVDITFDLDPAAGTIEIHSIVRCEGKTGVEMEAMTACAIAAMTIYDMCKSAEKGIVIDGLQLMRKSGGKSGTWER